MKLVKSCLVVAGISAVVAVPLAIVLNNKTDALNIERSQKQNLELHVESVKKELKTNLETIQQKQAETEQLKQENEKLKSDLQAKREKQEAERVAAEQARVAPVAVSAPRGGPDCNLAQSLIAKYDWPQSDAYKIMMGESTCNPNTANWKDSHPWAGCTGSFGLFQINCSHGQVYDAAQNVAIAYAKFVQNGRTFCTTSGWVNTCKKMGVN